MTDQEMTNREALRLRLGQALRNLRLARGLTATQLALRMGKRRSSSNQISRWELGRNAPGGDQRLALLTALDMSFADLDRELNPAPATNPRLRDIASRLQAMARATA